VYTPIAGEPALLMIKFESRAPEIATSSLNHWNVRPAPVERTRSVSLAFSQIVRPAGELVIAGGTLTVSCADELVVSVLTGSQMSFNTQSYRPASDVWTEGIVYDAEVAPGIVVPFLRHSHTPSAVASVDPTVNVVLVFAHTVRLVGCAEIVGAKQPLTTVN
jgi:hypothetical protein